MADALIIAVLVIFCLCVIVAKCRGKGGGCGGCGGGGGCAGCPSRGREKEEKE